MSSANPTMLQIGAKGTLYGWPVRVIGRVVMRMEEAGEKYYWQEYNLVDEGGTNATLVFEDTDDGPEWKLFTLFEPKHPMTAREAATKRVGDMVNLDGKPTAITLLDESEVFDIEGTAPEGVEVGDVASYFNADQGERMLVASWTGDEIEFYEGRDLEEAEVAEAFGLSARSLSTAATAGSDEGLTDEVRHRRLVKFGAAAGVALVVFVLLAMWVGGPDESLPIGPMSALRPRLPLSTLKLDNGARGRLLQGEYTITDQAVVAVCRQGVRHERREYQLRGDGNERALLVNALNGPHRQWHLFLPIAPPAALGAVPPYAAAAQRVGARLTLEGRPVPVVQLCLTFPVTREGADAGKLWPGTEYGFVAHEGERWAIARWTEGAIRFFQGTSLSHDAVMAEFKPQPVAPPKRTE